MHPTLQLIRRHFLLALLLPALLAGAPGVCHAAIVYDVVIDTTALDGSSGNLSFSFLNGEDLPLPFTEAGDNGLNVFDLKIDGAALVPDFNPTQFDNDAPLEFFDLPVTFGDSLTFTFSFVDVESFIPPTPDQFAFFLTGDAPTFPSLVSTTDLTGADALFTVDIFGEPNDLLTVFGSETDGVTWTVTPRQVGGVVVPEPASLCAWSILALGIGVFSRRRFSAKA